MRRGEAANREAGAGHLWDLTPLCHPAWWLALALLLVNDNLLKGAGVAPGWLTGKLSDFAFLVVAPVLLTALLPFRLSGRRVLAFALVVGVYVAADVSPAASDAIVLLAGKLGFHWKLWPDLTDLVALSVLPGSWWIAGRSQACARYRERRVLEPAGVFVGAVACLATSSPPKYEHYPFLVNQTKGEQTVTFVWLLEEARCDADLSVLASMLTADDLDDAHTETIASGQVAALDDAPTPDTVLAGKCQISSNSHSVYHSTTENCVTAIVSAAGGPSVLVSAPRLWWEYEESSGLFSCSQPPAPASTCEPTMDINRRTGPDALSLHVENGALAFEANENLRMIEVSLADILAKPGDGTGCRSQRDKLNALLDEGRTCSVDSDCYVAQAGITIPGESLCNVYVNRSLTPATLAQYRASWDSLCRVTSDASPCGGGLVQPPVCRAGKCEEMCPGENLPGCYPTCSSWGLASPPDCAGWEGLHCDTNDGQRCVCKGTFPRLFCEPHEPISATCPLMCTADYATKSTDIGRDDAATPPADGGRADLGGDARASGVDSSPMDR